MKKKRSELYQILYLQTGDGGYFFNEGISGNNELDLFDGDFYEHETVNWKERWTNYEMLTHEDYQSWILEELYSDVGSY